MALFHKNAVITGVLDSYCLPCEIHLKSEHEIKLHIGTPDHKKFLASTYFVENYKDDGIRKVKQGYYCEYCNKLLITTIKIDMHVSEGEHKNIKNIKQLQLRDNAIVVFNKIAIDEDAWHGLVGSTCALCNIDLNDKEKHKNTSTHLLHLVQSNVELDSDGAVYRKGENFFYCLICNALFALNALKTHLENSDHIKCYKLRCESYNEQTAKINSNNISENQIPEIKCEIKNDRENKPEAVVELITSSEKAPEEKRSNENVNSSLTISSSNATEDSEQEKRNSRKKKKKSGRTGKEPSTSSPGVEKVVEKQNESQKNETVVVSLPNKNQNASGEIKKNLIEEAKQFAKANQIKYEEKRSSAFCSICNVTISSDLKRLKEHVAETTHKKTSEQIYETLSDAKTTDEFVIRAVTCDTLYATPNGIVRALEVVINNAICITFLSFSLITNNRSQLRCHLCEENVRAELLQFHCKLSRHDNALNNTRVLRSLSPEFVREVRPGLYHCGFCNIIEGTWTGLMDHLKSTTHSRNKNFAYKRLQEHLTDIAVKDMTDILAHILFNS